MQPRNPARNLKFDALDIASPTERKAFVRNKKLIRIARELCQNIIWLNNMKGNYLKAHGEPDAAAACFRQSARYRSCTPSSAALPEYERAFKELNNWFVREHQSLATAKLHYRTQKDTIEANLLQTSSTLNFLHTSTLSYVYINDMLHSTNSAIRYYTEIQESLKNQQSALDSSIKELDSRLAYVSVWQTMFLRSQSMFNRSNHHVHLQLGDSQTMLNRLR